MRSLSFSSRRRRAEYEASPRQHRDQSATETTRLPQPLTEQGRELQHVHAQLEAARHAQTHEQSLHAAVLEQRDRENKVLSCELKEKAASLASLDAQHKDTLAQLLQCRKQLAKDQARLSPSKDSASSAKPEQGGATLVAELQSALAEAQSRNATQAAKLGALEESLAAADAERESLASALKSQEGASAEQANALAAARESIDVCRSILVSIPGVIHAVDGRTEDGQLLSQKDVVSVARMLHKRCNDLIMYQQTREKHPAIAEAEARAEEAEAEAAELHSHCDALEAQLSALRVREAKNQTSEFDVADTIQTGHLAHLEARLKGMEEMNAGTLKALRRTEKRLLEEREKKAAATAISEDLQQQIKTLREVADIAKSQAELQEEESERLKRELGSQRQRSDTLRLDAEAARKSFHEQAQQAAEATELARSTSLHNNTLEKRLKSVEEGARDERSKLRARDEMLRLLREELAGEQQRRSKAESSLLGTPQLLANVEAQAGDAERERDNLQEKLKAAMADIYARDTARQEHVEAQVRPECLLDQPKVLALGKRTRTHQNLARTSFSSAPPFFLRELCVNNGGG